MILMKSAQVLNVNPTLTAKVSPSPMSDLATKMKQLYGTELTSKIIQDYESSHQINTVADFVAQYHQDKLASEISADERAAGYTPLIKAVSLKRWSTAAILLALGEDPNARTQKGNTAIHIALLKSDLKIMRILQHNKKINLNLKNNAGHAPVHIAIQSGNPEMFGPIIEDSRVDKNLPTNRGNRPLHLAVLFDDPIAFNLLLAKGADRRLTNSQGQTPDEFKSSKDQ